MNEPGFALFDTAIGRCAVAWSGAGLTGVQLPEADDALAARRLARRFPGATARPPGAAAAAAIVRISAFLAGALDEDF